MGDTTSRDVAIDAVDDALILFDTPQSDPIKRKKCIEKIWKIIRHHQNADILDRKQASSLLEVLVWRSEARSKLRGYRKIHASRSKLLKMGSTSNISTHEEKNQKKGHKKNRSIGSHTSISKLFSQSFQGSLGKVPSRPTTPIKTSRPGTPNSPRRGFPSSFGLSTSIVAMEGARVHTLKGRGTLADAPRERHYGMIDFRTNTGSKLRELIDSFLDKMDSDRDGRIKKYEFMLWAANALSDPVATLEAKSPLSKSTSTPVNKRGSIARPASDPADFTGVMKETWASSSTIEQAEASKTACNGGVEGDQSTRARTRRLSLTLPGVDVDHIQRFVFEDTPVFMQTPFGLGRVIQGENKVDGQLKVQYEWSKKNQNATGYYRKNWAGGFMSLKPDFIRLAKPLSNYELPNEIRLYHRICHETLDDNDIANMTERQIILLLPVLIHWKSMQLRRRMLENITILRQAFWLHRSVVTLVHKSYVHSIMDETPAMQKEDTIRFFTDLKRLMELEELEVGQTFGSEEQPLQILCPIYPERTVVQVRVIKLFTSGHSPVLLGIRLSGLPSFEGKIIFKPDELRSDMMIMRMFEIFNVLWRSARLPITPYSYTFKIVATDEHSGVMEFIERSEELQNWNGENIMAMDEDTLNEFIRSAAGSFVGCYILGCRDRHKSNFMVQDDRVFLQIDFKHCFDHKTRVVDAPHFAIAKSIHRCLKKRKKWKTFKDLCLGAFKVLRRTQATIVHICTRMFRGLWFEQEQMETWLLKAFRSHETERQALISISELIDKGHSSWRKKLKNFTHSQSLARKHRRHHSRTTSTGWTFGIGSPRSRKSSRDRDERRHRPRSTSNSPTHKSNRKTGHSRSKPNMHVHKSKPKHQPTTDGIIPYPEHWKLSDFILDMYKTATGKFDDEEDRNRAHSAPKKEDMLDRGRKSPSPEGSKSLRKAYFKRAASSRAIDSQNRLGSGSAQMRSASSALSHSVQSSSRISSTKVQPASRRLSRRTGSVEMMSKSPPAPRTRVNPRRTSTKTLVRSQSAAFISYSAATTPRRGVSRFQMNSMDDRSDSDLSWDEKHRRLASMKAKEAASLERTEDLEAANLSGSEEDPTGFKIIGAKALARRVGSHSAQSSIVTEASFVSLPTSMRSATRMAKKKSISITFSDKDLPSADDRDASDLKKQPMRQDKWNGLLYNFVD